MWQDSWYLPPPVTLQDNAEHQLRLNDCCALQAGRRERGLVCLKDRDLPLSGMCGVILLHAPNSSGNNKDALQAAAGPLCSERYEQTSELEG